jgi:hypothetical protein
MLYITLLFWLGTPARRFGYVDNVSLLAISMDLQTNYEKLQKDL